MTFNKLKSRGGKQETTAGEPSRTWEIKKLGEVSEILNGGTPKTNIAEYWDGDIHWITPADLGKLKKPTVDDTPRKITRLGLEKSSAKLFPENSIILSTRAPIGHLAINEVPMSTNQGCRGIVPSKKLDTWFLYYFLKKNVELLDSLGTGATFKELSTKALAGVEIPLPPLPEQQRIVSILDEAFAAIAKAKANAEQNLKNAAALFESYLQGVFEKKGDGWEIKTLGEVSKINYGYTEKASFDEVGPKFLRITDIQDNGVDWGTVPYCKCSDKDLPKYKLETGDIVFARTGATTGKSYLINNPPNAVFASYLIRLRMNSINEFIPEFISYFFRTKTYWDKINAGISGSAQGGFNATKLSELEFHFPKSKTEQQTIVRQLDALRAETQKLEAVYQKKIDDLEELKKSILQKAFAGELMSEPLINAD